MSLIGGFAIGVGALVDRRLQWGGSKKGEGKKKDKEEEEEEKKLEKTT